MLNGPQLSHNAPWKQRFRARSIVWIQTSDSNPARGLVVTIDSGQYQLYAWNPISGKLRQLTFRTEGVPFGTISPDGRDVYYLADNGGNEIGHFVRLPFEGGKPQDITPELPPYSAFGLSISRAGNLAASTVSDDFGFHAIVSKLDSGYVCKPREILRSQKIMFGPSLSYNGEIGVVTSREHSEFQHYSLVAIDIKTGQRIAELRDGEESGVWPFGFSPLEDDFRFLAISNRSGFSRPVFWSPLTGERSDLPLPPLTGDVTPMDWSMDGKYLLLSHSHQAVQHLSIYDLTTSKITPLDHPRGHYGPGTGFAANNEIFAVWQDTTHPSKIIALDNATGRETRTLLAAGDVPPGHPWQPVTYTSADGETVQGWLAKPAGLGPFPTILHTHGGPETSTVEYFLPPSQAWVDHGFAWLAINYRGSTGFGRAFREKIWGNPGKWELEDMLGARDWLIKQGIAIPEKILLTGWSYGGYLTLLALGKHPDLWAGGMAGTATVDWSMEYEHLSPALRGYSAAIFGGKPEEKPEQYARSSPMTYLDKVRAPILIIQGRNDTRTPARPVEVYEARLKALGKSIEVHWFDEGHLGGGVEQDIQDMEIMLRFAYRVLSL